MLLSLALPALLSSPPLCGLTLPVACGVGLGAAWPYPLQLEKLLSCFSPKDEEIPFAFEVPKPLCIFFSQMKFPLQKQETENTNKQKKSLTQISPTRNRGCHPL